MRRTRAHRAATVPNLPQPNLPRLLLLLLLLLTASSIAPRFAAANETSLPTIPAQRLVLNSLSIFRYNPIGLETRARFGWQQKFFEGHHRATNDNFWFAGTYLRVSPAGARAAAMIELQPLAIFNLRFTAEKLAYFGNFTFLQSRSSANDDLSDAAMKANAKGPLGNYSGSGTHVSIEPRLQAAIGPIVVRSSAFFGHFNMALHRGDRVWYEATLDVPVPGKGWVFANDLDVLYRRPMGEAMLTVGARYSMVRPLYNDRDVLPSEDADAASARNDHHRVGLVAAYTFYDRGVSRFNKPTILVLAHRYLDHRFRTGTGPNAVNGNIPYFVLGYAFETDLLSP